MSALGIHTGKSGNQENADSAARAPMWDNAIRIPDESKSPFKGVSKGQLALLRDGTRSAKGTVIVLVHPWYEETPQDSSREEIEKFIRYQDIVTDLLTKGSRPIVILEEFYRTVGAEKRLQAMGASNYLLIPTEGSRSVPFLENRASSERGFDYKKLFGEFYDALMDAGARKILIAGLLSMEVVGCNVLNVDRYEWAWLERQANPPNRKTYELGGCVGSLYRGLIFNALEKTPKGEELPVIRLIPRAVYPAQPWYHTARTDTFEEKNMEKKLTERGWIHIAATDGALTEGGKVEDSGEGSLWSALGRTLPSVLRMKD